MNLLESNGTSSLEDAEDRSHGRSEDSTHTQAYEHIAQYAIDEPVVDVWVRFIAGDSAHAERTDVNVTGHNIARSFNVVRGVRPDEIRGLDELFLLSDITNAVRDGVFEEI